MTDLPCPGIVPSCDDLQRLIKLKPANTVVPLHEGKLFMCWKAFNTREQLLGIERSMFIKKSAHSMSQAQNYHEDTPLATAVSHLWRLYCIADALQTRESEGRLYSSANQESNPTPPPSLTHPPSFSLWWTALIYYNEYCCFFGRKAVKASLIA